MTHAGRRLKGNAYERRIAKIIVVAFAPFGITRKDCYRTPSSGGHRFAKKEDPGDLVMSPALRLLFNYSVECKHYRSLDWVKLFSDSSKKGHWSAWWAQANEATNNQSKPALVFSANRGAPSIMVRVSDILAFTALKHMRPSLRTTVNGDSVTVVALSKFLVEYTSKLEI